MLLLMFSHDLLPGSYVLCLFLHPPCAYWVHQLATVLADEKGRVHAAAALVGLASGSRSDVRSH